jgi:hypothetical protein
MQHRRTRALTCCVVAAPPAGALALGSRLRVRMSVRCMRRVTRVRAPAMAYLGLAVQQPSLDAAAAGLRSFLLGLHGVGWGESAEVDASTRGG